MESRVLIVEDNEAIAGLEKHRLEKYGFSVEVAATGAEGLNKIRAEDFDLLVIDYNLPDMSGVELMERVKRLPKNIPSVIVTGGGNENIAVKAMKFGAMDYVVKNGETIKHLPDTCSDAINRFRAEEENKRLMAELKSVNAMLAEANVELDRLAKTDPLTGIHNRRSLIEALSFEISRSLRYLCPLSLAIFDIDYFKTVNDTRGHQAGDAVLMQFAELLKDSFRKTDIIGRYGGEEFGVILTGTAVINAVMSCDRVRESVSKAAFNWDVSPIRITVSAGVACLVTGMNAESLIAEADRALYEAKRSGRNRVLTLQEGINAPQCLGECNQTPERIDTPRS